ncbi:MAG: hypothetical protein JWO83_2124, partial [Caulobacteraceae bacterium]|nr:hypothetical protein [Caulobacteraceae bacterium]
MKMKLMAGVALAAATAASGAWALNDGWYGAIDVGAHQMDPLNAHSVDPGLTPFRYKTRTDVAVFGRLGYQLMPHLRFEVEGGYRPATLKGVGNYQGNTVILCNPASSAAYDGMGGITGTCGRPVGSIDAFTVMANAIVDILPHSRFDPFIGGGVGAIFDKVRARGTLLGPGLPPAIGIAENSTEDYLVSESDTEFAYQGIGGIAFQASDRLAIDLTYRYMESDPIRFHATSFTGGYTNLYKGRYKDNSLTLGLRYAFGAPPPPPPPPPPP